MAASICVASLIYTEETTQRHQRTQHPHPTGHSLHLWQHQDRDRDQLENDRRDDARQRLPWKSSREVIQSQEWGTIMETISVCARTVHKRAGKTICPGGCQSIIQGSRYELEHRWHRSLDTDQVRDMKNVFGMD
ncbi:hypothetical protein E4U15_002220 [Claviceps sp. LM218 group G6]|nr:hypothetical protein E4U15_002220 [Claviceps sp. LM218 group G6]KAG6106446.1 hypothetical protein E4U14_004594 [Claviceps sp. LM454 group G7]